MAGFKVDAAFKEMGECFTFSIEPNTQFMFTDRAVSGKRAFQRYYATRYSHVGGNGKQLFDKFIEIVGKQYELEINYETQEVIVGKEVA